MATEKSLQINPFLTISLFGVPILRASFNDVLALCERQISINSPKGYVCFVNVHTLTESKYSPPLREALEKPWIAVADGVPLLWLARLKRHRIESRICGPDFMRQLSHNLQAQASLQGLLGGAPGCPEKVAKTLNIQAICFSPPVRPFSPANARADWQAFLNRCPNGKAPNVVWVGLGAPKQELWMAEVSKIAPNTLFFGVGAAFDFLSGRKKRAPVWMQKNGLEWFFRLTTEPRRLWRRYLVTNLLFVFHSIFDILSGRQKETSPSPPVP